MEQQEHGRESAADNADGRAGHRVIEDGRNVEVRLPPAAQGAAARSGAWEGWCEANALSSSCYRLHIPAAYHLLGGHRFAHADTRQPDRGRSAYA